MKDKAFTLIELLAVIVSATCLKLTPKEKRLKFEETVQLNGTIEPSDVTNNALT